MKIAVARNVYSASIDDTVIILDLNSDSYYCLDKNSSRIWRSTIEEKRSQFSLESSDPIVSPVVTQFELDAFFDECLEMGLCARGAPESENIEFLKPSRIDGGTILAIWSIFLVRRSVAQKQLLHIYGACRRLALVPDRTQQSEVNLEKALDKFRFAENFFALGKTEDDCLPRSLALFRFLRILGFKVNHHIGVRLYPFHAHAWVEFENVVLLDSQALCNNYTQIASLPA